MNDEADHSRAQQASALCQNGHGALHGFIAALRVGSGAGRPCAEALCVPALPGKLRDVANTWKELEGRRLCQNLLSFLYRAPVDTLYQP